MKTIQMLKICLSLTFVSAVLSIELRLTNGRIRGTSVLVEHQMLHWFKRIPFAQPPVGRLRFQKPQPALNWTDLDATEYGNACMINTNRPKYPVSMSEDCLFINVFTSNACLKNETCPVFFLVHGGAFAFGNAVQYNDTQILEKFVKHDIVFVLPAYRVSFFGFLDLGHDYEDAPYNVGLYDIIASLEWVHKEIRNFGGDSRRVTLMGYSSGATAVEYLYSSPKFQNHELFQQVMLDSGSPVMTPGYSRNVTEMLLNIANCSKDYLTNQPLVIDKKLECLRAIPAEQLNMYSDQLKQYWQHLEPQSNKDLMPFPNYIKMAERRRSLPLLVMTSTKEKGTTYEPEDTVEHVCTEFLRVLNYYQNATIDACIARYSDTYNLTRDFSHAIATMECVVNNGGRRTVDSKDRLYEVEGVLLANDARIDEVEKTIKKDHGDAVNIGATFGGGTSTKSPVKSVPCYLGVFAQANHSQHANDMLYLIGPHQYENFELTMNDILMNNFYPQLVRNFAKGLPPTTEWLPTNEKGENYYILDFEVTSLNRSEGKWPTMFSGGFNKDNVDFFLNYLLIVEQNASQFHSNDKEKAYFGTQRFLEMSEVDDGGERNETQIERNHEDSPQEYYRPYCRASLWAISLVIGTILLCMIFLRANRRRIRKVDGNKEPIYPVINKNLQYGAI